MHPLPMARKQLICEQTNKKEKGQLSSYTIQVSITVYFGAWVTLKPEHSDIGGFAVNSITNKDAVS